MVISLSKSERGVTKCRGVTVWSVVLRCVVSTLDQVIAWLRKLESHQRLKQALYLQVHLLQWIELWTLCTENSQFERDLNVDFCHHAVSLQSRFDICYNEQLYVSGLGYLCGLSRGSMLKLNTKIL